VTYQRYALRYPLCAAHSRTQSRIALGIGANTAIFTAFNGILLHPLPDSHPERPVAVQEVAPKLAKYGATLPVNSWHFREWRKQNRSFEQLA